MEVNAVTVAVTSLHDIPPNLSALLGIIVTVVGGGFVGKAARRSAQRRGTPSVAEKVAKDDFDLFREAYREEMDYVKRELREVREKLVSRTNQVTLISAAYRTLRDFILGYIADAHESWEAGRPPPDLTSAQRAMLEDPLEDDPDVYDTRTRAQIRAERAASSPPADAAATRRRPRH